MCSPDKTAGMPLPALLQAFPFCSMQGIAEPSVRGTLAEPLGHAGSPRSPLPDSKTCSFPQDQLLPAALHLSQQQHPPALAASASLLAPSSSGFSHSPCVCLDAASLSLREWLAVLKGKCCSLQEGWSSKRLQQAGWRAPPPPPCNLDAEKREGKEGPGLVEGGEGSRGWVGAWYFSPHWASHKGEGWMNLV